MTQVVIARRRRRTVFLLLSLAVLACSATSQSMVPRYITSASPIEYLCVAVDPLQKDGVWWWQSFTSGCATRSTGPGVFKADQATVSHATRSTVVITFRVGMHSTTEPFREIHLVIEGDSMHSHAKRYHNGRSRRVRHRCLRSEERRVGKECRCRGWP